MLGSLQSNSLFLDSVFTLRESLNIKYKRLSALQKSGTIALRWKELHSILCSESILPTYTSVLISIINYLVPPQKEQSTKYLQVLFC